jgi:hypothetical protein
MISWLSAAAPAHRGLEDVAAFTMVSVNGKDRPGWDNDRRISTKVWCTSSAYMIYLCWTRAIRVQYVVRESYRGNVPQIDFVINKTWDEKKAKSSYIPRDPFFLGLLFNNFRASLTVGSVITHKHIHWTYSNKCLHNQSLFWKYHLGYKKSSSTNFYEVDDQYNIMICRTDERML